MRSKDAIELVLDEGWRTLRHRLNAVKKLVDELKNVVPQHSEVLDSIVRELQSEVKAAAKQIPAAAEENTEELALSGDILGFDSKETWVSQLLQVLNTKFQSKPFMLGDYGGDLADVADFIHSTIKADIEPHDLVPFSFYRIVRGHNRLFHIEGVILPDRRVLCTFAATSEEVGPDQLYELYTSAKDFVDELEIIYPEPGRR